MNRARARAETVMSRSFRSSDRIARRSKDNENVYANTALRRGRPASQSAPRVGPLALRLLTKIYPIE